MKCAGGCGGKGGEANYYVPVWECGRGKKPNVSVLSWREKSRSHADIHALQDKAPALMLWFFDSRGGMSRGPDSKELPDWVDEDVGEWVEDVSTPMKVAWGESHSSLVFAHIAP